LASRPETEQDWWTYNAKQHMRDISSASRLNRSYRLDNEMIKTPSSVKK
jgi:hypothetical protein